MSTTSGQPERQSQLKQIARRVQLGVCVFTWRRSCGHVASYTNSAQVDPAESPGRLSPSLVEILFAIFVFCAKRGVSSLLVAAKLAAPDLARDGLGQLGDKLDPADTLVRRKPLARV